MEFPVSAQCGLPRPGRAALPPRSSTMPTQARSRTRTRERTSPAGASSKPQTCLLLSARPLVDLVVMNLAFLAARRHRHADALAGVGAAGGTVPAFFIGI